MPRCPVKQPNGKYAVYSTVVDSFVLLDATVDEVLEDFSRDYYWDYPGGKEKLTRDVWEGIENIEMMGRAWKWAKTWQEALYSTCFYHGPESDSLKHALQVGLVTQEELNQIENEARKERERLDVEDSI